jgi:putative transposase
MARLPRYAAPGQPLHVIQRGNNRSALFTRTDDYVVFYESLHTAMRRWCCQIHAYVLMTNHVHLLLSADQPGNIGRMMQSLGRRYVRYFNDRNHRTGTLWEGRYRATVIDTDKYLFTCHRYIEENPVRANMVGHPGEYRWSSYAANAAGAFDLLVTPHDVYRMLGVTASDRQFAYRGLFRTPLGDMALSEIRDATNHAWALGTASFHKRMSQAGRRTTRVPRGRRPKPAHR